MRYSGEARFNFSGDKQKAMSLIPQARTLMGILLNDASFNQLQQARRQYTLKDGIIIEVVKLFDMKQINIHVPVVSSEAIPSGLGEKAYYFTLFKVNYPIAIDGGTALGYSFDYQGQIDKYWDGIGNDFDIRYFICPNTRVIATTRDAPNLSHPDILQCIKVVYSDSSKFFIGANAARTLYDYPYPDTLMAFSFFPNIYVPAIAAGPTLIENEIKKIINKDIDETQDYWNRDHIPNIDSIIGNGKILDWCDYSHRDNNTPMDITQLRASIKMINDNHAFFGGRTVDYAVEIKKFTQSIQGYLKKDGTTVAIPDLDEYLISDTRSSTSAGWTYAHTVGGVTTGNVAYYIGSFNQYQSAVSDLISRGGIAGSILDNGGLPKEVKKWGTGTTTTEKYILVK